MNFLFMVSVKFIGATIAAAGLAYQAQGGSDVEGSGAGIIKPPQFPPGVGGSAAGSEIYENSCKNPGEKEHYEKCIVDPNEDAVKAGVVLAEGAPTDGSGMNQGAEYAGIGEMVARDINFKAEKKCLDATKGCISGCQKAAQRLDAFYKGKLQEDPPNTVELTQIQVNIKKAESGVRICKDYYGKIVARLRAQSGAHGVAELQADEVERSTRNGGGSGRGGGEAAPSRFDQLGGGDTNTSGNNGSGGSSMSPWLVGGIGAAVGGLAGYMFGKNKGEDQGYEEGKKDAEEAAKKEEEDKDGDGTADCAKAESATKTECKGTFYAKCDKDPVAEGCSDFADSYCKTTDPVPDAAFCRKMSAANYCAKSDSINKGNCMSCREISSGFTGQYSPEDLANSCAVCSGDPLCSASGSYFAYRAATGNTNLAGGGNTLSPNLPGTAGGGIGGGSGSSVGGTSTGSGGGAGNGGSGPFGQSLTGGGPLASGAIPAQNSGANQYRISSSHSQSNFRVHSSIIQRFCQQGSMVGCGPLVGVSGDRGVSSDSSEGESSTGVGAQ